MNYIKPRQNEPRRGFDRVQLFRGLLVLIGGLLVARLFYIQIIRHDYYQAQALAEHIKKFEISAPRGLISLSDGAGSVPVVLNEQRYDIYADPQYISDPSGTADKLLPLLGGDRNALISNLQTPNSRYVVLAKKLAKDQADKIDALQLKGIGEKAVSVRTYPQGTLAAQLLGFVNDDGQGQYGVEESMNDELAGKPGLEKAVTDVRGIPLAVNNSNILTQAVPGKDVTLTIDIGIQKTAEDVLKAGVDRTQSKRGSVVIMDANTGAIKAMANYPTYDPSNFGSVADIGVFKNAVTSGAWEPGSVMKPLLMGAAFTEGTATPDTSYFDPGYVTVDGSTIRNSENWGARTMTVHDVINLSLNVGAVYVEKTLGGGDINDKARQTWYNYLTQHYFFGKLTGVQQSGEESGVVHDPNTGYGLNVIYANMAFGQGVTVTPLQLAAAYSALVNGGTYYKPTLVASQEVNGKTQTFSPQIVKQGVVSEQASAEVRGLMEDALKGANRAALRPGYTLGAKSGTAQIAGPDGKYLDGVYDGAYAGFIGGDKPQYVMIVRLDEPKTNGFASSEAAKVWADLSNKLIDNFAIKPNSH